MIFLVCLIQSVPLIDLVLNGDTFDFDDYIVSFIGISDESWLLALERTNWSYGEAEINILVLSIIYKGSAIPLFWEPLPKKGNANTEERQAIILHFLKKLPAKKIKGLLCDRAFVGYRLNTKHSLRGISYPP